MGDLLYLLLLLVLLLLGLFLDLGLILLLLGVLLLLLVVLVIRLGDFLVGGLFTEELDGEANELRVLLDEVFNLLLLEEASSYMRFCCPTCPYVYNLKHVYSSKVKTKKKQYCGNLGT